MSGTSSRPNSQEPLNSPKFRAWATSVDLVSGGSDEFRSRIIAFSTPELRSDATSQFSTGILPSGATAAQILLKMHQQQALVNPYRTHPSWFAAIRSKLQPQTRHFMKHLSAKHEVDGLLNSIMSDCVSSLWAERLVGDLEPQPDDPPAVRVVEGESRIKWLRRLVWCGRIKLCVAGRSEGMFQIDPTIFESIPTIWAEPALHSIETYRKTAKSRKNSLARLGLVTLASLSGEVDHRRQQWLLQHFAMELGMALAPWLRIGKPPVPADQLDMERWILISALKLADGDTILNPASPLPVVKHQAQEHVANEANETALIEKTAKTKQKSGSTANELRGNQEFDSSLTAGHILGAKELTKPLETSPHMQPDPESVSSIEEAAGPVIEKDLNDSDFCPPEMESEANMANADLSEELPLFEDSIEILQMNHHDSGLFDLDMDIMLDTDESQQIPPAIEPQYDDAVTDVHHDTNLADSENADDSSSSFALGDLQL